MYNFTVCVDEDNMEVVNCQDGDTLCGNDHAETCEEYIQDGEKILNILKEKFMYA